MTDGKADFKCGLLFLSEEGFYVVLKKIDLHSEDSKNKLMGLCSLEDVSLQETSVQSLKVPLLCFI